MEHHGVLTKTLARLTELWDQIGVSEDVRTGAVEALNQRLARVCEETVGAVQAERAELRVEVDSRRKVLAKLCEELCERSEGEGAVAPLTHINGRLQAEIRRLNEIRISRLHVLTSLVHDLQELCQVLHEPVPNGFEDVGADLSTRRIEAFTTQIELYQDEKSVRSATIHAKCSAIVELWRRLDFSTDEAQEDSLASKVLYYREGCLGFSQATLDSLDALLVDLSDEKTRREEAIRDYGAKVTALWDRLSISQGERDKFFATASAGLSMKVLDACKDELERLEYLKAEHLSDEIAAAKEKITTLWDALHTSDDERAQVLAYSSQELNDGVVDALNNHAKALQVQYEAGQPIIALIIQRDQLAAQKEELDAKMTDPKRLLDRRAGVLLMKEEKIRQKVSRELPIIEKQLEDHLINWSMAHGNGRPFVYEGEDILQKMKNRKAEQERAQREDRERQRRERQERLGIITPGKSAPQQQTPVQAPKTPLRTPAKKLASQTPHTGVKTKPRSNTLPVPGSAQKLAQPALQQNGSASAAVPPSPIQKSLATPKPQKSRLAGTPLRPVVNVGPLGAKLHKANRMHKPTAQPALSATTPSPSSSDIDSQ